MAYVVLSSGEPSNEASPRVSRGMEWSCLLPPMSVAVSAPGGWRYSSVEVALLPHGSLSLRCGEATKPLSFQLTSRHLRLHLEELPGRLHPPVLDLGTSLLSEDHSEKV